MAGPRYDPELMAGPRYDPDLMVPQLDQFLGVTLLVCSVIAVLGNVTALAVMGRICRKGNAKFSTIIFFNIAFVNLVRFHEALISHLFMSLISQ